VTPLQSCFALGVSGMRASPHTVASALG